jgi:hypothetical protein
VKDNVNLCKAMYVISLSNISIKANFEQIARVELKCVQYYEGDYIVCMTSRYFFRSFTNVRFLCFVSHSYGMTSCQGSSAENVSCSYLAARLAFCSVGFFYVAQPSSYDVERTPDVGE